MSQMHYFDGVQWKPVCDGGGTGGGGGLQGPPGPPGPPGLNGESVTVYGPQVAQPVGARPGDIWFQQSPRQDVPVSRLEAAPEVKATSLEAAPEVKAASLSPASGESVVSLSKQEAPSVASLSKEVS